MALHINIIAFSLPEIIEVLVSEEDVKFNQDLVEVFLGSKGQEDSSTITVLLSSLWRTHKLLMVQKSLAIGGSSSITRK